MTVDYYWRKRHGFRNRLGVESSGVWVGGYLHLWWVTLFVARREKP